MKPPDALSRAAALVNGQPDPLQPAHEINSTIGPQVSNVLARGMSQNREQRYMSAAGMSQALKGTEEVSTGKSEAATVIRQSPASTVADAPTELKPATVARGETTVVRPRATERPARFVPLAIGAAVVVLVGAVFGGYYALQRRNNDTQPVTVSNANEESSPQQLTANSNTAAPEATIEPSPVEQVNSGQLAKRKEPTSKKTEKPTKDEVVDPNVTPPSLTDDQFRRTNPNSPSVPNPPNTYDPFRQDGLLRQRPNSPVTRTFPDGTRLITNPDGTRVLISPNGNTRVFQPGQRIDRRRRQNPPTP